MRKSLAVLLAFPIMSVIAGPARASGGGGCGAPITEAAGTSVDISEYCFVPTVLYASAGEEITWTNQDPTRHDVLGSNAAWGSFEAFSAGKSRSRTFDEAGVYAYVCTWHPGMSGVVVVGDGGFERLDIAPVSSVQAGGRDVEPVENSQNAKIAGIIGGAGILVLLGVAFIRRRKTTAGS